MTHLLLGLLVVFYLYSTAYCVTALLYLERVRAKDVARAVCPIVNSVAMVRDLKKNW